MIAAGRAIGERRRAPRPALLAAIGAAHLAAIWLLLRPGPTTPTVASQPPLTLFEVEPPPLPDVPARPPPRRAINHGGGSPGIRRERAAVMIERPEPPEREAMAATLLPTTPLPLAALTAGSAPLDLGGGGDRGTGIGSGSGSGSGDGDGRDDGEDGFAVADWIKRPPPEAYRRYWPVGRSRPAHPVEVRIACFVRPDYRPHRCRFISEAPSGSGFQTTAIRLMTEAKVRPVSRAGEPVWDIPVFIAIVFDVVESAPRIPATSTISAPRAR